ncbi:MAG: hypothetical protein Q4P13_05375 [Psychrobacter sp.]|nr:hypothetical protein [Psychrobacter sp.]
MPKTDDIDKMVLKLLPFIMIFILVVWAIFRMVTQAALIQRATYQNISKVQIDYPGLDNMLVYDITTHPAEIKSIVDEINSQSYGPWRQSFGGKEGASVVSLTLYRFNTITNKEEVTASFSLYPESLMERAKGYRQLNAQGMVRPIDIRKLPTLQDIWCDSRNATDYNMSMKQDYCLLARLRQSEYLNQTNKVLK